MKTLFTIGKFVLPVIFVCAMGYFLLPMTNSGSPEAPIVERESAQPLVKESIEKTQSNESSDVSKNGSSRIQKKKPATISKSSVEEKAKIDDPFENVSSALELGQMLFWDPILSGNRDVSCATCHHPDFAYADSRDLSIGTLGVGLGPDRMQTTVPPVRRNAHTIVNTAFNGLNNGRGRGRGQ
ncbi:MAG TPA: cytochrome-c peroxidase, partial [Cyclobacteriaceae bacterium]|nr:cytochrome-c peroxidase [Cyclobacteriaceae bacterium]